MTTPKPTPIPKLVTPYNSQTSKKKKTRQEISELFRSLQSKKAFTNSSPQENKANTK